MYNMYFRKALSRTVYNMMWSLQEPHGQVSKTGRYINWSQGEALSGSKCIYLKLLWFVCLLLFETVSSYVAQAGLGITNRWASHLRFSCLSILSVRFTGMSYHTEFKKNIFFLIYLYLLNIQGAWGLVYSKKKKKNSSTQQRPPSLRGKVTSEGSDTADTNQAKLLPQLGSWHHNTGKLEDHFQYWGGRIK